MLRKTEGIWRKEEAEYETGTQNHRLNGHEFEQTPGDNEGQRAWRATAHGAAKSWT